MSGDLHILEKTLSWRGFSAGEVNVSSGKIIDLFVLYCNKQFGNFYMFEVQTFKEKHISQLKADSKCKTRQKSILKLNRF